MKRYFPALLSTLLLLAGCKADFVATADYSELFAATPQMKLAHLSIEVPACTEPNTEFESSAVLELKSRIPAVLPQARFLSCEAGDFTSFARFSTPVRIGRFVKPCEGTDICIGASAKEDMNIVAAAGQGFREGLAKVEKASSISFEPSVTLRLAFDIGRDVQIVAPSLFVDDEPYHFANLMLKDGEAHAFRLSDVATEAFFEGKETTIFLRLKERAPEQRL